jgi:hypothetical protein
MAIPEVNGMPQVIMHGEDLPIIPITTDILTRNKIQLSKNQKLRIAHSDVVEVPHEFRSARQYVQVIATQELLDQLGLDDYLLGKPIGISLDILPYEIPMASTTTDDTTLVQPSAVMAADDEQGIVVDNPGNTGGEPMNSDNYLTTPAWPNINIPGDTSALETSSSSSI